MSDPTPATGEAARGIDLDAIERAAHDVRENGLLGCVPGNEHAISTETVLALVARVRSAEVARDAALARVKELEAGIWDKCIDHVEMYVAMWHKDANAGGDLGNRRWNYYEAAERILNTAKDARVHFLAGKDDADANARAKVLADAHRREGKDV